MANNQTALALKKTLCAFFCWGFIAIPLRLEFFNIVLTNLKGTLEVQQFASVCLWKNDWNVRSLHSGRIFPCDGTWKTKKILNALEARVVSSVHATTGSLLHFMPESILVCMQLRHHCCTWCHDSVQYVCNYGITVVLDARIVSILHATTRSLFHYGTVTDDHSV